MSFRPERQEKRWQQLITGLDMSDSKLQRLLRWRAGESPGPWQIVVFPTNRCNLKCGICWQRGLEERIGKLDYSGELPDARLLALVDEAAKLGVQEWSIAGGGEPFVRAGLVMDMCARIRTLGMNGGVYTNGSLVKGEHLEHLVDIGWQRIDLSLDGPTAEINDAIRGAGSFDRALTLLQTLNDIKAEKCKGAPIVDVHFVLTHLNLHAMDDMIALVAGYGVHDIGFSILQVESEQCVPFAFTDEDWSEMPALAQQASETASRLGINSNISTLLELDAAAKSPKACGNRCPGFEQSGCFEPFLTVAVLSEGFVGPCCAFWDESADNLRDKSLAEVWNGDWFRNLRERMVAWDFPAYCEHCPSHFVWLNDKTRGELEEHVALEPAPPRPASQDTLQRLVSSIKGYGVFGTLRRGIEWALISLRKY